MFNIQQNLAVKCVHGLSLCRVFQKELPSRKFNFFSSSLFLTFQDRYNNNFGHFLIAQLMQIQKMSKSFTVAVLEGDEKRKEKN